MVKGTKDVRSMYKLPTEVSFCKKCTISNQRPRITFDANGVCSACNFAETKSEIQWDLREKELQDLCDRFRKSNGEYDVIVPCSGGKDGSFVAHQLKHKYGMHPLAVTWSPLQTTEIGRNNLDNFITSGFNHILGTASGQASRKLTKLSFEHLGDPFQPFIYGVANFPLRMAVQNNVSLIMYGENGEVEYGGDMKNAQRPTREISDHDGHYFSNMPPEVWGEYGIDNAELFPYLPPSYESIMDNKTEIHFLSYYIKWDPQENYYYSNKHTGFQCNPERTEGTYSKYASLDDRFDGFHYYLSYMKFGIGRATSDSAHEIRDGKITRDEGVALVRKYDGEFPQKYFQEFLDYCSIDEDYFWQVMDSWRGEHVWQKDNNMWKLKKPVWEA